MDAKHITRSLAFSSVLAFASASAFAAGEQDQAVQDRTSPQVQQDNTSVQQPAMGGGAAGGAVIQDSESAQQDSLQQSAGIEPVQDEEQLIELQGKSVVNAQGEEIGQIDSIVRDKNDQSLKAVVSSGGFLGMGGEKFAVSADELQPQGEDQVQLSTAMSQEEIQQAASSYDEQSYEPVSGDTATGGGSAGGTVEPEEEQALAPAPQTTTGD